MPYDRVLADRIRECLQAEPGVIEQPMFGGLAFLINGNMSVSASGQGGLLLRVPPDDTDKLAAKPHTDRFVMRGREMAGWLRIEPDGVKTQRQLQRWVTVGVTFARSLPAKRAKSAT